MQNKNKEVVGSNLIVYCLIKLLIKGSQKASKLCVKVSFYLLAHTDFLHSKQSPLQLMSYWTTCLVLHISALVHMQMGKGRCSCLLDPMLNTPIKIWCENNAGRRLKLGDLQIAKTAVRGKH